MTRFDNVIEKAFYNFLTICFNHIPWLIDFITIKCGTNSDELHNYAERLKYVVVNL